MLIFGCIEVAIDPFSRYLVEMAKITWDLLTVEKVTLPMDHVVMPLAWVVINELRGAKLIALIYLLSTLLFPRLPIHLSLAMFKPLIKLPTIYKSIFLFKLPPPMHFPTLKLTEVTYLASLEWAKPMPLAIMEFAIIHIALLVHMDARAMKLVFVKLSRVLFGAWSLNDELAITLSLIVTENTLEMVGAVTRLDRALAMLHVV